MEPERGAGGHVDRLPRQAGGDVGRDAAALVGGEHRVEASRHDLEPTVGGIGVVDRDHGRHVAVDHRVRGSVLMRRVSRAARQLVVDLLLVEHRRLSEERAGDARAAGPRRAARAALRATGRSSRCGTAADLRRSAPDAGARLKSPGARRRRRPRPRGATDSTEATRRPAPTRVRRTGGRQRRDRVRPPDDSTQGNCCVPREPGTVPPPVIHRPPRVGGPR